jgi:nicotinamidase-related amidase
MESPRRRIDEFVSRSPDSLPLPRSGVTARKGMRDSRASLDIDMLLRSNGRDRLMFTGVTTEGCVESSVRDAGFLDYFPIVIREGVASDIRELHDASLRVMSAYRADVISIDEAIGAMTARRIAEGACVLHSAEVAISAPS